MERGVASSSVDAATRRKCLLANDLTRRVAIDDAYGAFAVAPGDHACDTSAEVERPAAPGCMRPSALCVGAVALPRPEALDDGLRKTNTSWPWASRVRR